MFRLSESASRIYVSCDVFLALSDVGRAPKERTELGCPQQVSKRGYRVRDLRSRVRAIWRLLRDPGRSPVQILGVSTMP